MPSLAAMNPMLSLPMAVYLKESNQVLDNFGYFPSWEWHQFMLTGITTFWVSFASFARRASASTSIFSVDCLTHWHRIPRQNASEQRTHCTVWRQDNGTWPWDPLALSHSVPSGCQHEQRRNSLWRHSWGSSIEMVPTKDGLLHSTVYGLSTVSVLLCPNKKV